MWKFIIVILFHVAHVASGMHPDADKTIFQIANKHGYSIKEYFTQTEDGYIISLHRLSSKNNITANNKDPALMVSGIFSSGEAWLLSGPNISLAYLLVDKGYDVWLINVRGTRYSRGHVKYNADYNPNYWKYSWDEIGRYDLPAAIRFILKETSHSQLYYFGHSRGTTSFFVMAAERPEYNKYIKVMFAFSPVAYNNHMSSPMLKIISRYYRNLHNTVEAISFYELFSFRELLWTSGKYVCGSPQFFSFCISFMMELVGFDWDQIDPDGLKLLFARYPDDLATMELLHYAQGINSGQFKRYDFGAETNLKIYGQKTPPEYDLRKITAPAALFYSKNDRLLAIQDARKLAKTLPNVIHNELLGYEKFNHFDFLHAAQARKLLYESVLGVIEAN